MSRLLRAIACAAERSWGAGQPATADMWRRAGSSLQRPHTCSLVGVDVGQSAQPHSAPLQGLQRSAPPLPAPAGEAQPAARGCPFRGGPARLLLIQARPASGAAGGPGGGGGGGLDEAEVAAAAEQLTLEALHLLGAGRAEHAEYLLADGARAQPCRLLALSPVSLAPCWATRRGPVSQLQLRVCMHAQRVALAPLSFCRSQLAAPRAGPRALPLRRSCGIGPFRNALPWLHCRLAAAACQHRAHCMLCVLKCGRDAVCFRRVLRVRGCPVH